MSAKYLNKYRSESARAQWWDYGRNGAYFITICTYDRQHFFGHIQEGQMHLSPVGVIADLLWYEIKNHAHHVELGEFVVMPNHIHGILILDAPDDGDGGDGRDRASGDSGTDKACLVATGQNRFQNPGKNTISTIVGGYKSAVSKHARRLGFTFGWQSRFHDHIIRDEASYQRIAHYIATNPQRWAVDQFHQ